MGCIKFHAYIWAKEMESGGGGGILFVWKADFPPGKQVELMQCAEGRGTFLCTWKEGAS